MSDPNQNFADPRFAAMLTDNVGNGSSANETNTNETKEVIEKDIGEQP